MLGLVQVATVYGEGVSTFDQVLKTDLACRLSHVNAERAGTLADRAELLATRRLLWGPEYVMPEGAQVDVDGIRWQIVAGTYAAMRGPNGQVVYRAADAVRQV